MGKKAVKILIPVLGFLFLTAYIRSATVDVVYTDYLRLINSYLPDVADFRPYLKADILTRTPFTFLMRLINVRLFGYSTTFDMILGALGLTWAACELAAYMSFRRFRLWTMLAVLFAVFSLDKWELLTNGTGWIHFWAVAFFIRHYRLYDRIRSGQRKMSDELWICLLPVITILLFAGQYCVIYVPAMLAVYIFDMVDECRCRSGRVPKLKAPARKCGAACKAEENAGAFARDGEGIDRKSRRIVWLRRILCLLIPFLLYVISFLLSDKSAAGATDRGFFEVLCTQPALFLSMIVKSFAAVIITGETVTGLDIPESVVLMSGVVVLAMYVHSIIVNFRSGLYRKTALPLLLLISGLAAHAATFVTRWRFLDDAYLMSSRYSLQYMLGAAGIILTMTGVKNPVRKSVVIIAILAGQLLTTGLEISKAPYRQAAFEQMRETAYQYQEKTDEELQTALQYHHDGEIKNALKILEDNHWNIWRDGEIAERKEE